MAKTILDHTGPLTFSTIDTLLTRFKDVSEAHEIHFRTYKKIMTVMIESLENVCKYNEAYEDFVSEKKEFQPTFELSWQDEDIRLKTSNPVRIQDVVRIRGFIDRVNKQDRHALKEMYQEVITNGKFSSNGGAGLGFIEMARTSGRKLEYDFVEVTEQYAIFTFIVTFVT